MNQSRFLPAVHLTGKVLNFVSAGWLFFQRGQWVQMNGGKGRWLGVGREICWRFRGESFRSFNLRFRVALVKALHRAARRVQSLVQQLVFNFAEARHESSSSIAAVVHFSPFAHGRALFRRVGSLLNRGTASGFCHGAFEARESQPSSGPQH